MNGANNRTACAIVISCKNELLAFFDRMATVDLWCATQAAGRGWDRNEAVGDFLEGSIEECVVPIWQFRIRE